MYKYTDCGLDNVFLVNGFSITSTDYGEMVAISDTDGLHKAIAEDLVNSPATLTGAEFRFLRLEMDVSQRHLAAILNVQEQAVGRWERNRKRAVPGAADRMLRTFYLLVNEKAEVRECLERLAELDQRQHAERRFALKLSAGERKEVWAPGELSDAA